MTPSVAVAWRLADRFALPGDVVDVRPYGEGLINETFLVVTDAGHRAILQRINPDVFSAPEQIQRNLRRLLDHVGQQPKDIRRQVCLPAIVPARDGADFHCGGEGFWRMSRFIEGSETFDVLTNEDQAHQVGSALGRFHALFSDLSCDLLYDTLPGFHVTPSYLQHFDQVLAEQRRSEVDSALKAGLDFVESRRSVVPVLEEARRQGVLRTRVIHGDPKVNNVLFERRSGLALGLIDLDTVKPGLIHYDLGDCLRSCCNLAGETGTPEDILFDTAICRSMLEGYFAAAGESLTLRDVTLLYEAIRLIPFELGLRFLTDHLEGSVYFRVTAPEQNLRRAWVQFRLVQSIERQASEIQEICERAFAESGRVRIP